MRRATEVCVEVWLACNVMVEDGDMVMRPADDVAVRRGGSARRRGHGRCARAGAQHRERVLLSIGDELSTTLCYTRCVAPSSACDRRDVRPSYVCVCAPSRVV